MVSRSALYRRKNKTMVIDSMALCHQAKHSLAARGYDGSGYSAIEEFFTKLLRIQRQVQAKNWVFCWDSIFSIRRARFRGYKQDRLEASQEKKTPEEEEYDEACQDQFNIIQFKLLKKMGFVNCFGQEGYEGDDIIASLIPQLGHSVIVSRDNDLFQLLDIGVDLFDPMKMSYYTFRDFRREYGIRATRWAEVKRYSGCAGDKVPGLPGIGNKKAIDFLKGKLNPQTKTYKKFIDPANKELIELTGFLTQLPLPGLRPIMVQPTKLKLEDYEATCLSYGLDGLLSESVLKSWKKLFRIKELS